MHRLEIIMFFKVKLPGRLYKWAWNITYIEWIGIRALTYLIMERKLILEDYKHLIEKGKKNELT